MPPETNTAAARRTIDASAQPRAAGPRAMWLVARMAIINQLRRVVATLLLLLLPIGFYMSLRSQPGSGASMGGLATASGWAMAFTALFGFRANAGIDVRLTRLGLSARWIFVGRLLAYAVLAVGLALGLAAFAALVDGTSIRVTVTTVLLASMTAVPVGILVGVLVPGEVEGTFVVLALYGIPFSIAWDSPVLRFAPSYGALRYAYNLGTDVSTSWFIHPLVVGLVATVIALALWGRSTRRGSGLD